MSSNPPHSMDGDKRNVHIEMFISEGLARFKISQTGGGDLVSILRKAQEDVLNAGMTPPLK